MCKEKELLHIDENVKTGRKRKASTIKARTKRKCSEETLNHTLVIKVYPNYKPSETIIEILDGIGKVCL